MKHLLTTTPVLKMTDPEKEFTICIDAYQEGVGGVLMQEGRVIVYESWKLKYHEKLYSTYELELTVVAHALKVWRHYLLAKKFLLMIDHNSLTSFFKKSNLNSCQARLIFFLREFYFYIRHLNGKENHLVDVLSKKLHCLYEVPYCNTPNWK